MPELQPSFFISGAVCRVESLQDLLLLFFLAGHKGVNALLVCLENFSIVGFEINLSVTFRAIIYSLRLYT